MLSAPCRSETDVHTLLQARAPAVGEGWCSLQASSSKTPTITSEFVHEKHALPLFCFYLGGGGGVE